MPKQQQTFKYKTTSHWIHKESMHRQEIQFPWLRPLNLADACILRSGVKCENRRLFAYQRFKWTSWIDQVEGWAASSDPRHGPEGLQFKTRMKKMAAQINFYLYLNAVLPHELFGAWKLAHVCEIKVLPTCWRTNYLRASSVYSKGISVDSVLSIHNDNNPINQKMQSSILQSR